MTEEDRLIVESLLSDLIRLTRPSGPAAAVDGPLSSKEMAALLAELGELKAMRSPDAQDLPLLPGQLD